MAQLAAGLLSLCWYRMCWQCCQEVQPGTHVRCEDGAMADSSAAAGRWHQQAYGSLEGRPSLRLCQTQGRDRTSENNQQTSSNPTLRITEPRARAVALDNPASGPLAAWGGLAHSGERSLVSGAAI